jgi:hypothetical protein
VLGQSACHRLEFACRAKPTYSCPLVLISAKEPRDCSRAWEERRLFIAAVQHPFPLPLVHRMWHNSVAVDLSADSKLLISLYGRIAQLVRALASHAFIASDYDQNPSTKSRQINSSESFRDACRLSGACLRRLDHNSCTKPPRESLGRLVCQSSVPLQVCERTSGKMGCVETVYVSFRPRRRKWKKRQSADGAAMKNARIAKRIRGQH